MQTPPMGGVVAQDVARRAARKGPRSCPRGSMMRYCVVLVTAPKKGNEAKKLARLILKQRLAACVNILKGVDSLFWWKGKIDSAQEDLMVIKTRRALLPALTRAVKKAHSYSVCEVVALPIIGGNKPYLDWLGASCRKG